MEFHFLGTGNAFGHGGRRRSHYLWKGQENWLIDASYDALSGLRSIGMSIMNIDRIFISHLHPDHFMAIPQFALENYYAIKKKTPITLFVPIDGRETIIRACQTFFNDEVVSHLDDLFEFQEIGPNEEIEFTGGRLQTLSAQHTGNARMQIIEKEGKKLGYTGDTAMISENFSKLLEADFVITEASSGTHPIPDHITLEELFEVQNPNETPVYISHVGESTIAMKDQIKHPLILTEDNMIITL